MYQIQSRLLSQFGIWYFQTLSYFVLHMISYVFGNSIQTIKHYEK